MNSFYWTSYYQDHLSIGASGNFALTKKSSKKRKAIKNQGSLTKKMMRDFFKTKAGKNPMIKVY